MSVWRQNAIARGSCLASPRLAAYRLGFLSRALRCFQEYYWDNGEDYGRGVGGALARLHASRIALADTILPAVAAELRMAVRRLARHNAQIRHSADLGHYRESP